MIKYDIDELNIYDMASLLHEWTGENDLIIVNSHGNKFKVMNVAVVGTTIVFDQIEACDD